MTKIMQGPLIQGEVVNAQTGSPMAGVVVVVSSVVFSDAAMTTGVTTLTTNQLGVFTAYAGVGMYLFTTTDPLAADIEPINVLGTSTDGDANQALLQAAFAYSDAERARAEAAESNLLSLLAGGPGSGGTGGGGAVTSGLTIVALGGGIYSLLPFGDVTLLPDPDISDVYDLTPAGPVTVTPNGDGTYGVSA